MKKRILGIVIFFLLLFCTIGVPAQNNQSIPAGAVACTSHVMQGELCTVCNGTGNMSVYGTGMSIPCVMCVRGRLRCMLCQDRGWFYPESAPSGGGGQSSSGTSGGTSNSSSECRQCSVWGNGVCNSCNGTRRISNPYGGNWLDCPNCYIVNGQRTGQCRSCQGTGRR